MTERDIIDLVCAATERYFTSESDDINLDVTDEQKEWLMKTDSQAEFLDGLEGYINRKYDKAGSLDFVRLIGIEFDGNTVHIKGKLNTDW